MTDESAGFVKPSAEPNWQRLGERLRNAREYVGLKQEDVARHLSIPRSALSHIEAGQRKVDALELTRIAKLYQRPVSWFTGETDSPGNELPKDVAHVAKAAAKLSSEDRQELARFADFLRSRAKAKVASDD
jgi:transcriptional regulator with XRE-family HTH domain